MSKEIMNTEHLLLRKSPWHVVDRRLGMEGIKTESLLLKDYNGEDEGGIDLELGDLPI